MNNNKLILKTFLFAGLLSLLSACVTTETGLFTEKVDDKKAVQQSVDLSKRYIQERKWDLAKRHLKKALEMDDESAEVHEAMALVFQNTGEFERAEEHYKESIDIDPNLSRARLNYGSFLYGQKRYKDAVKQFEVVVDDSLYPRRYNAFVNLGRSYYMLADYKKAEENYSTAYMMRNRHHPGLFLQMAEVYYRLGQFPKSQKFFDRYNQDVKSKSASALLLGARLAKQFDDKDAISSYGLALKNLYPRSQQYLDYKQEFMHGS